jgi:hypothetical protein
MIATQKTDILEVMLPASQTAALATMASRHGTNTVGMASSLLCAAIEAHPDVKKTQGRKPRRL